MKKKILAGSLAALILTAAVLFTGCGTVVSSHTSSAAAPAATAQTGSAVTPAGVTAPAATPSAVSAETEDLFTDRDLSQTPDLSEAAAVTVADGDTVTLTEAGVYVLSGSAKEAQVVVDAGDEDKVQLVLDGLSIVNADKPCILVENADKVFLTSAEGRENSLTVSGVFSGDEDAVIFSRDDLVLNGLGTVTVISSKDGIRTNDDLKLTGGAWNISASDAALKAHDSICAYDGVYVLEAGSDGLHAEDNDDDTAGSIVIEGGSFTIRAGDDGVHATTSLTVNGGTLTVSAAEGMEATQVIINSGVIGISASDDGINAGRKSKALSVKIEISGGELAIVMGAGDTDGIDSNGDLIITGGTIDVTGQSPFDYDGSCTYTGGTLIVNGQEIDQVTNQMMGGGMMGGQPGGFGGKQGGQPGGKRW